jgi:PAS domain S-box-containing protein
MPPARVVRTTVVERSDEVGAVGGTPSRYRHLIEHIQDAVAEFELRGNDPVVRRVNGAFVETFGYDRDAVRGESLNDLIVPAWRAGEARELDVRTAAGEVNYRRVKRETAGGLREFLYRGVPFADETARVDGFAVYTDLTEITRHERRLQVMNRVLRHNLRNDVNVVLGNATSLLDGLDDPAARTEALRSVVEAGRRLTTLADEASAIDRALNAPADDAAVDLVPVVHEVVAEARREFPRATLRTALPDALAVRATDHLAVAVESLVDNAVRHNPADSPRVWVRADAAETDGWADLRIEDDGPQIPADERRVVAGDAEITQVHHGSGLGLWVVKWVTESFGGEVSFEESDAGGNSVRLRLPR